jgi:hypothetical protein
MRILPLKMGTYGGGADYLDFLPHDGVVAALGDEVENGEHAVVLGAGTAGLLAALVLLEFYETVSVVERDELPDHPRDRRGVPQGRHLHNFLGRGTQVLAELFPGLLDEMAAAGAVVFNDGDLSRIYARVGRCELKRSGRLADPSVVTSCLASRPVVEFHVRRRVTVLLNVRFLDGHDVIESLAVADAVTGVRILNRSNGMAAALGADLVVDAAGRGARTPSSPGSAGLWPTSRDAVLNRIGLFQPTAQLPNGCLTEQMVRFNQGPGQPGGLLLACEHGTWMLAIGRSTDAGGAPADFATMLALAAAISD